MRFWALRLDFAGAAPGGADFAAAARWALSLALYGGILLGLAYATVKKVFSPAAVLCVSLLALAFATGISAALENWPVAPPAADQGNVLGGPGLIARGAQPPGAAVVLLQGPEAPSGAQVLAPPGGPMVFHEWRAGAQEISLAAFESGAPRFLQSLAGDLGASADNLRRLFGEGLPPFLAYAGALVFMLSSLVLVLRLGSWPLASFFLGALAFRGALALEAAVNSREAQAVFASFLRGILPQSLAAPGVFLAVGLLAHLCSLLIYLSRRKVRHAAV